MAAGGETLILLQHVELSFEQSPQSRLLLFTPFSGHRGNVGLFDLNQRQRVNLWSRILKCVR